MGEVLGKYHPHGDTAVYDAMVRMAQDWNMRYTLIDKQGNFGTQDGDGPAAMRYTEARLQRLTESMLNDLDKDTVNFQLNFDDTEERANSSSYTYSPIIDKWLKWYRSWYGHKYAPA